MKIILILYNSKNFARKTRHFFLLKAKVKYKQLLHIIIICQRITQHGLYFLYASQKNI